MNFAIRSLIEDFVKTAKENGASLVFASLPRNDEMVMTNQVCQIRNGRALAEYNDELGNVVRLCNDKTVRQF